MKLYENFINDGTLTNFYGGKTDSGYKLQINGEEKMKIDIDDFNRKAEHIIETVVKPQVAKYELSKQLNKSNMELTVTGTIKVIEPIKQISDKFSVRMFVLTVPNGEYPQEVIFQLAQDKCKLIENYSPGIDITVKFNLRGREYNGKYYNTLDVWNVQSTPVVSESFDDSPF